MRQRGDVQIDDLELALEIRLVKVAVCADAGVVHERDDAVVDRSQARGEMLAIESSREIRRECIAHDAVPIAERASE